MIELSFPQFAFRIKNEKGKEIIFDECRKQWVALTPEEWVRQNFLQYLLQVKNYPKSLIAVEKELVLGDIKRRFDILVYKNDRPWMMVECKEMNVQLDEKVLNQVLNYNVAMQVEYLVITNGKATYALQLYDGNFLWIDKLPEY